ncbi:DUF2795 domain-containing protein [Methanosarcina sp.]|uniref:DUF2795 domain-containing protein n=1 Tax=Methanosarcina sp. TaxID=2213 RepID=UPI0029887D47|nr:DUF2795 domain-containing protein [Methanosarcina sp.]MDW5550379.1 DUF2795 domain-containing protein [Methanosarcina sp.]MDW5554703.1 DUF2795 domain-containing protein [Methanosarcina sp.]MDW5560490.1 DUF2795 domain-containing protein [Methanosarcina sp.]
MVWWIYGNQSKSSSKVFEKCNISCKKQDLIENAKKNNASNKVLETLENIPDKEYTRAEDVNKEFQIK